MLSIIFYGLLYGCVISMPIGPANIELIRRGMHSDFKDAFEVGIGAALSDAVLCLLVYFGVVKIILMSKFLNSLLGIACAVLMFYFGFSGLKTIFIDKHKPDVLEYIKGHGSKRSPIAMGFSINTTNPMVIGFWVVFLGAVTSYCGMEDSFAKYPNFSIFLFSFFVFLGALSWFYVLAKIVHKSKKYITSSIFELISFVCSSLFIIFGLILTYGVYRTIFIL
jgi:threonine/homoserine/homoserine lactone efflux protein